MAENGKLFKYNVLLVVSCFLGGADNATKIYEIKLKLKTFLFSTNLSFNFRPKSAASLWTKSMYAYPFDLPCESFTILVSVI